MDSAVGNQIFVNVGSVLAGNGLMLLAVPGRFAVLRTNTWMPHVLNQGLGGLARHRRLARGIGVLATVAGVTMVVYGLMRTDPDR